jgi:uncharacterized protein DUF3180
VKPVSRRDLAVLAVGLGVASWLLVRSVYGLLPPLAWWLAVPLGVLAVAEAQGARTLRTRLTAEREARLPPDQRVPARAGGPVRPVEPMVVARLAVLAQASAYVGAVFVGIWAGVLVHVAPLVGRLQSAGGDSVAAALGLACAAGLVLAALRLESVCRVPPSGRDDGPGAGARS